MNRYEDEVELVDALCRDSDARRELLWLGAREKGDDETVRSLERADPTLTARMRPIAAPIEADPDAWRRREAWAQAWHTRYDAHMARLARAHGARRRTAPTPR